MSSSDFQMSILLSIVLLECGVLMMHSVFITDKNPSTFTRECYNVNCQLATQ